MIIRYDSSGRIVKDGPYVIITKEELNCIEIGFTAKYTYCIVSMPYGRQYMPIKERMRIYKIEKTGDEYVFVRMPSLNTPLFEVEWLQPPLFFTKKHIKMYAIDIVDNPPKKTKKFAITDRYTVIEGDDVLKLVEMGIKKFDDFVLV